MPLRAALLLLLVPLSSACAPNQLGVSVTACGLNHTRHAAFYWTEDCGSELPPPPIWNLNCDLPCPAGSFLDVDRQNKVSTCTKCPPGTYNIGGGEVISGADGDWTRARSRYSAYCYTAQWIDWVEGQGCTPWSPGANGEAAYSGQVTIDGVWLSTDLVYYANLVRPGSLKIRYSKLTRMFQGFHNGAISIQVNNRKVHFDDSLQKNHLQTFALDLPAGPTEITITFEKFNAKGYEDVSAKIVLLEVRGTSFNSHNCFPCKDGVSQQGADHCEPCPADHYLWALVGTGKCVPCSEDTYSAVGSLSKTDCLPRKPCTEDDYGPVYSSCHSDITRTRSYVWHEPFICNSTTGVSLPPPEQGLSCEICNPGEYHAQAGPGSSETMCKPCPPGTAVTESKVKLECKSCEAGTYTLKVWNVTSWNSLPTGFATVCIPRDGENCETQQGWIPRGSYISTGKRTDKSCQVSLTRIVNITESNAELTYQFSLELKGSGSNLTLEIDGAVITVYSTNQQATLSPPVHLERGLRVLRWTYNRESAYPNPTDSATIFWIAVSGLNEGGSPECVACPPGHYSEKESESCTPCPAGSTHNAKHQGCDVCPTGTVSDRPGNSKGCTYCPANTQPSGDHTHCVGSPVILYSNKTFAVSELTGISGNDPVYVSGICTDNERIKLFCKGNFYGPIPDNSFNEFYLSVINPGNISLRRYSKFDSSTVAYAWGLLNKTNLPSVSEQDLNLPDDACIADFSKLLVNLGSKVAFVAGTDTGFLVKYTEGSLCSKNSPDRFNTEISFECDKVEADGWPSFYKAEGCTAYFQWRTKYACEVCILERLHKLKGPCKDGRRTMQALETEYCYYPGGLDALTWEEDCSSTKELVMSWQGLVGVIALCSLSVAVLVLFVCFCKVKKKYQLLKEEGDQMKGVELT